MKSGIAFNVLVCDYPFVFEILNAELPTPQKIFSEISIFLVRCQLSQVIFFVFNIKRLHT